MALIGLVHCAVPFTALAGQPGKERGTNPKSEPTKAPVRAPASTGPIGDPLPTPVMELRGALLAAVRSGRLEDLQLAVDWNELPPEVGAAAGVDPLAHLKSISADGEGREILAALGNMLAVGPASVPLGRDFENAAVYVWPYLAEIPLDKLTPADEVALLRLMPPADAKTMREAKKWTWWRLAIGADGTWHALLKRQ